MRRKAMIGKAVISLATGSLAVLLLGLAGTAALAQTGHEVVNCFDAALGTVHKTLARDCSGEIITDDKAAAVRQERRDYIQKILSTAPYPDVRGKQLASLGSGFFVTGDGSVVTSHHVVADCAAVSRSEEHTSELQSLMRTSYAVFCLKKKKSNSTKE